MPCNPNNLLVKTRARFLFDCVGLILRMILFPLSIFQNCALCFCKIISPKRILWIYILSILSSSFISFNLYVCISMRLSECKLCYTKVPFWIDRKFLIRFRFPIYLHGKQSNQQCRPLSFYISFVVFYVYWLAGRHLILIKVFHSHGLKV